MKGTKFVGYVIETYALQLLIMLVIGMLVKIANGDVTFIQAIGIFVIGFAFCFGRVLKVME